MELFSIRIQRTFQLVSTIMKKITDLLKDIAEYPYTGIGKPEPLKYELAGYWSRRINSEHRIIYSVHDDIVTNILNFYEISL